MSLLSVIAGRNRGGSPPPTGATILATFFDDNGDSTALTANPSDRTVSITAPSGTIAIVVAWLQPSAQTASVTVGGVSATQLSTHAQNNQGNAAAYAILGSFSGSVSVQRVGARAGYAQHAVIWCIGGSTGILSDWRSTSATQGTSLSNLSVSATPTTADGLILAHMGHLAPANGGTTSITGVTEESRDDTTSGATGGTSIRSIWGWADNSSTASKTATLSATGSVAKTGTIIHIPDA